MNLFAIIPAFNEAANIANVIADLSQTIPSITIVVIDDGSRDNTAQVAHQAGAIVLHLPHNLGIGGAVQTGLRFAVFCNADYIIRLDGDGQHPASQIFLLLEPILRGELDIAIGTRFLHNAAPCNVSFPRRVGIMIFCTLTSILSGQKITDPTSGFMAMNSRVAAFLACNLAQDYPEADARVMIKRAGFKIGEIYTQMRVRQGGISSITPLRAFYYVFKVSLSVLAARTRILNQFNLEAIRGNRIIPFSMPNQIKGGYHATIPSDHDFGA